LFLGCSTSKISFNDCLTCKIKSLNDIFEIGQSLNGILCAYPSAKGIVIETLKDVLMTFL